MSEDPNKYLRELGRPQVQHLQHGLRTIQRTYAVSGLSENEAGTIVMLPYWEEGAPTFDEEFKSACLVGQEFQKSADDGHMTLVRTYQELGSNRKSFDQEPVEVGKPNYKRDANNLLEVTREFIQPRVVSGEWKDAARIGIETFENTLLAKIEADEGVVFVKFKKTYIEQGIISTKRELLYDQKLTKLTVRTVGLRSRVELDPYLTDLSTYDLVSESEGSGSLDYQFGGLEVRSWLFVKGTGLVTRKDEQLGQSGSVVEEVWITTEDSQPSPGILSDDIFYTERKHLDHHTQWTFRGVDGDGVLNERTQTRFDELVTQVTIKQIDEYPETPEGFEIISSEEDFGGKFPTYTRTFLKVEEGVIGRTSKEVGSTSINTEVHITAISAPEPTPSIENVIETREDTKEHYKIWTFTGVDGDGDIKTTTTLRYGGDVSQIRIRRIDEYPDAPTGYIEIGSEEDFGGNFPIFEKTFLKVEEGVVGRTSKEVGSTSINTEVYITAISAPEPTPSIENVIETREDTKEHYKIWTFTGVDGDGDIKTTTTLRYGGDVSQIRIRRINEYPNAPAGYIEIGSEEDLSGNFPIFEKTFLKVEQGVVGRTLRYSGTAVTATEVHITSLDAAAPSPSFGNIVEMREDVKEQFKFWTFVGVITAGIIETNVDYRANGAIEVHSMKSVGATLPLGPSGGELITNRVYMDGMMQITHRVWVVADGLLHKTVERKMAVLFTTTTTVRGPSEADPTPGAVLSYKADRKDGYVVYSWVVPQGNGVWKTTILKDRDGIHWRREYSINQGPPAGKCIMNHTEEDVLDTAGAVAYTNHTYDVIQGNGMIEQTETYNNGVTFVRKRSLGAAPVFAGTLYQTGSRNRAVHDAAGGLCYTLHDVTHVKGSGEETLFAVADEFRSDGSRLITTRAYDDYKDPSANAPGGAPSNASVTVEQSQQWDNDGRKVFMEVLYVAPDDYTVYDTMTYFKHGRMTLVNAEVLILEQPFRGPRKVQVEVTFGFDPDPVQEPEWQETAPSVKQTMVLDNGSAIHDVSTYHDYVAEMEAGTSLTQTERNKKVDGVSTVEVTRTINTGSGLQGNPGVVKVNSRMQQAGQTGVIYRTEIATLS